ncbi:hypothetical protein HHL11_19285 [Ramlibacter sp. G-1-2-2]|uniref:Curlin n=1 Tax=Ramlibacter agri TaxID=2728837 RepID=A0A848H8V9_9BURK|nr:hypothetical protein [Ramlibacter agri]NML45901.1 hypothetical protein [Ramlibacter agri]
MKTHLLPVAIGVLALAAAGVARADHGDITQTGTGDTASIDQASNGGYFYGSISQTGGSGNTATIAQSTGDSPSYATAYVTQADTSNSTASVTQSGNVDATYAYVTQNPGSYLRSYVTQGQLSGYSRTEIWQGGNNNELHSTQNAAHDARLFLNQGSTATYVGYYFDGYNYQGVDPSMATPDTVNSYAQAEQTGTGLTGYILQYGANQQAYLHQEGSYNLGGILQTGSSDTAYVSQYGTNGQARVAQYGANHYASISQYGVNNVASIVQH